MTRYIDYRLLAISVCGIALASCAWMSTYVDAPGVTIEKLSNRTARIVSANFWLDGDKLSLRGEVVSNPVSKSPLGGHLDIQILSPDDSGSICLTTRARLRARHVRKTYSIELDALPPPGSTVSVWHHPAPTHTTCQRIGSSTTTTQAGSSRVLA